MKTASHILSAIESGDIEATSEGSEILLLFKGQAFCRLGCLRSGSPEAKVVDGNVVRIVPSPGLRDGFQITCENAKDARLIADALQSCIDIEYPHVFPKSGRGFA